MSLPDRSEYEALRQIDERIVTSDPLEAPVIESEAPPPYSEAAPEWRLTYVDFAAKCVDEGGILTSPKFERFE